MRLIVGIGRGDPGEQVLVALTRKQVAVLQRLLAEFGQERVARRVGDDREAALVNRLAVLPGRGDRGGDIGAANVAAAREVHACYLLTAVRAALRSCFVRDTGLCHWPAIR
jgi:hypothetical protein